ncbi:hypothetical protein F5Y15DRAFT_412830 [Xylariaceae sp. FL0016]|nr:hypothetical protein F5Y15DRAFT_412830 [Xylariaceae sp. FL0016]
MAKAKDTASVKGKAKDGEKLPEAKRPGTSGTMNNLITNRRQASENFAKAQRAEKAYRAKKQAAIARANFNETKTHFREAFSHLKLGFKGAFSVVRAVPHLVSEKREARRKQADQKKRERHLEQKKKLEEELARQSTAGDEEEKKEE